MSFFKAGMIEAWGRGTIHIVDKCKKAGMPEPEFREEFGGLSVHFKKADRLIDWAYEARSGAQSQAQVKAESGLESIANRIIYNLEKSAMSKSEIALALGHKSISSKLNMRVNELLDKGVIERTIPDKPKSRLQKYRLTAKGRRLQAGQRGDKTNSQDELN